MHKVHTPTQTIYQIVQGVLEDYQNTKSLRKTASHIHAWIPIIVQASRATQKSVQKYMLLPF